MIPEQGSGSLAWLIRVGWVFLFNLVIITNVSAQDTGQVNDVLDRLHTAASESDFETYFGLYTPDAVFMGTDPAERWSIDDLKGYARPRFEAGKGWHYTVEDRDVTIAEDGNTAWFDETLHNENLGVCRGSGVLVRREGEWKIAQYNLSVPIPNALVLDVVRQIGNAVGSTE